MNSKQLNVSQPVPQNPDVTICLPMLEMACNSAPQYGYDPDVTMAEQNPFSSPFLENTAAPESFRFEETLFTELCFLPSSFMRSGYRDSPRQLQSSGPALFFCDALMPTADRVGQLFQLPNGGSSYFSSSLGANKEQTVPFPRYTSPPLASMTGLASSLTQPTPQIARAAQKSLRIFAPSSSSILSSHLASPLPSPQQFSPQPPHQDRQDPSFYNVLAAHGYTEPNYVSPCDTSMMHHQTVPEMLSPAPDQGVFEMTLEEHSGHPESRYTNSTLGHQSSTLPSLCGYQGPLLSFERIQTAPLATSLSPVSPSSSSRISTITATGHNMGGLFPPIAMSIGNHRRAIEPTDQVLSSSWTSASSISSPSVSPIITSNCTIPAQPSPLKRHFKSLESDSECDELKGIDDDDAEGEAMRIAADSSKRKRNRKPVVKTKPKNKAPVVKLKCSYPGCIITCASQPSLARHAEAHKWRGLYAPVRCEACQSALSNEFSVQRHILRSRPSSLCRQLRVYSIMRSDIEIESTVRFFPKRPHGKKTVEIDIAHAIERHRGLLKEQYKATGQC
ncbi:hypothetical protein EMPS_01788 [Entomortierella parvispora]|uniref:Uncharacterized protein n=1 Tax=Entomortierella parvispora TaxID=205924 RepID=A0A9P3LT44_9FUNG|nr:hypothetical protein EMPS_01788 [Entomortierella parvispora]